MALPYIQEKGQMALNDANNFVVFLFNFFY